MIFPRRSRLNLRRMIFLLVGLVASFGNSFELTAAMQVPLSVTTASQEKALKYHAALQRRPTPGYLYDRFYDTWLSTNSLEELETFLKKKAKSSSATNDQLLLAFFYAKQSRNVLALEQFRLALINDPTNAATLYEKAVVEARTLAIDTALTDLAKAAAAAPEPAEAIKIAQLQAKLLVRNRRSDEAIKIWSQLVKSNPNDTGLMEDVIELQITEGLFDEAEKLSDILVNKTSDPYQKVIRQLRKGDIFLRAGKRKQALGVYGNALGKVGNDSWLEREILGQIEQSFHREDDLVGLNSYYQGLLKTESKRVALWKASARVLLKLGKEDEAVKTYQEIVKLTPGNRSNRESFIDLLAQTKKLDLALKQTQSLIEQFPEDAELHIKLAELSSKAGNEEAVSKAIDAFLSISGESEYAFLRAARLLDRLGNKEKAERVYARAVKAFPDSVSAKYSQAASLYGNSQKEQALAIWNSIAAEGDRSQLVRVARIVSSRNEPKAAFEMLMSRFDEFKLDSTFLGQLCDEAIVLKKFDEATPWVTNRVKLSTTKSELDTCLPQAVQIIRQSNKAETLMQQLLNDPNRNTATTCLLVSLLERNGLNTKAEQLLSSELRTVRESASDVTDDQVQMVSQQQVRLYSTRRDWESAAEAAKKLVELPGGRTGANLRQLIEIYVRDGKLASALAWIGEWKRASPNSLLPWMSESEIYAQRGELEASTNVLRMATQKFPEEKGLFAKLGENCIQNGQYREAERIFWRQYENSEQLEDKLRWSEQLAKLSFQTRRMDELIRQLEERRKNNPTSVDPLIALAQAHRIAGNYEERRMALLAATRLQTDSFPILLEIARMEEAEGDWEKSIQTLKQAAKLDKTTHAKEQIARLYIRKGKPQMGYAQLLEIAGGANFTARDVESVVDSIIKTRNFEQAREFLLPQVTRFENDFRLKYQLAILDLKLDLDDQAIAGFLELSVTQNELPKKVSKANKPPISFHVAKNAQMIRENASPDAADLLEINLYKELVTRSFNYRGPLGNGGGDVLPTDAKQCRLYSACQLVKLVESFDEAERKSLIELATTAGLVNADVMFDKLFADMAKEAENVLRIAKSRPGNEGALGLVVYMGTDFKKPDAEFSLKAFHHYKDSYPVMAVLAALQAAAADKDNNKSLRNAISLVENIENPNAMLFIAFAQFTGAGKSFGRSPLNSQISLENIERLKDLLLKWYPKIPPDPNLSGFMKALVVKAFETDPTPDRFLALLEELVVQSKTSSRNQVLTSLTGFVSKRKPKHGMLVWLPPFPPQELVTFPESVLSMLRIKTNDNRKSSGSDSEEDPQKWIKKFSPAIDDVKDPILKSLLQIKLSLLSGEERRQSAKQWMTAAKATLTETLKSQPLNQDAYYLSASLAASEERWKDARDLFEQMRNLPMSKVVRQEIDGHLVAIAIQAKRVNIDAVDESVIESAKAAALRLRLVKLSRNQRRDLVTLFKLLGMKEEAKKLESTLPPSS